MLGFEPGTLRSLHNTLSTELLRICWKEGRKSVTLSKFSTISCIMHSASNILWVFRPIFSCELEQNILLLEIAIYVLPNSRSYQYFWSHFFCDIVTFLLEHTSTIFALPLPRSFQGIKRANISHYPFRLCFLLPTE